jgi:protein involved in polysaccharide export with SLBB domain
MSCGSRSAKIGSQLLLALVVLGTWKMSWAEPGRSPGDAQLDQIPPITFAATSEYFDGIYRNFYENYKVGPGDEIAVRVTGQPDFTLEHARVSPTGRIYHPLLGNVHVAHLTVEQLTAKLTSDFSEYILKPSVNVELLAAQSAKIGVLGDVVRPGIVVMAEPMTVLAAITASGGVADTGKKSEVTLLRQGNEGHLKIVTVNLKRILKGEADPEQNLVLKGGDTLIVHGNLRKKISSVLQPVLNLTTFMYFLTYFNDNNR